MFSSDLAAFAKKCVVLIGILIICAVLFSLRNELGVIITSLFFVALFHPVIEYLEKKHVPTSLGIIGILFSIFLVLLAGIGSAIPLITEWIKSLIDQSKNIQIENIIAALPSFIQTEIATINMSSLLNLITEQKDTILVTLKNLLSGGSGLFFNITSSATSLVLIVVFIFFFSLERKQIGNFGLSLLPKEWKKLLESNKKEIFSAFVSWMKGQALLSLSIFIMTLIGLSLLSLFGFQISHIFSLALVAGIAECIPYAGPIIALIPALSLALPEGIPTIIAILALYIIIQQTENNILVPYLVGKSLSLSPSYVLISTFLGFAIFGVLWVLVALPIAAVIQILLFPKKRIK